MRGAPFPIRRVGQATISRYFAFQVAGIFGFNWPATCLKIGPAAWCGKVIFDGKPTIELDDGHITGAGAAGVWTKADSVTAFDDFAFGGQSTARAMME